MSGAGVSPTLPPKGHALAQGGVSPTLPPKGRRIGTLLRAAGLGLVFSCASILGFIVDLNLPAQRRALSTLIELELNTFFRGRISVGHLDELRWNGVRASDVRVFDESGAEVLHLAKLRGRLETTDLLLGLIRPKAGEALTIVLPRISADQATLRLVTDAESGEPSIVSALTPRTTPKEPTTPGRPPRLAPAFWLPSIEIGHVHGHGELAGIPSFDAEVRAVKGSVLSTAAGLAVDVERVGLRVSGLGQAPIAGTATLAVRSNAVLWSRFDGFYGDVETSAFVHLADSALTLRLRLPKVRPTDARPVLPDWPLRDDLALELEARGTLPRLHARGRGQIANATFDVSGNLDLKGGNFSADLDVQAQHFDLRSVLEKAPPTDLTFSSAVALWNQDGQPLVELNGRLEPTKLLDQDVPATDFTAVYEQGALKGRATLHEPGLPLRVEFGQRGDKTELQVLARRFRIESVPRLERWLPLRGSAELQASAELSGQRLAARFSGRLSNASIEGASVRDLSVFGSATGDALKPEQWLISASLQGKDLEARGFAASEFEAQAQGPVERPALTATLSDAAGRHWQARGQVSSNTRLSELELGVEFQGKKLASRAASVNWEHGALEIEGAHVSGDAGELQGSLLLRPKLLVVRADGESLDIETLALILGLETDLKGTVQLSADVTAAPDTQQGYVRLAVGNGSIAGFDGVSLRLNLRMKEQGVTGDLAAQLAGLGNLGMVLDGDLAGSALLLKSWSDMTGHAELQVNEVKLALLEYWLPETLVSGVEGKAYGRFEVRRRSALALPSLIIHDAGTYGLKLVVGDPIESPTSVDAIEVKVSGSFNGESGDVLANVQLVDIGGAVMTASGASRLRLDQVLLGPAATLAELTQNPFSAVINLPDRDLETLPVQVRPSGMTGRAGGRLQLSGLPSAPTLALNAHINGFGGAASPLVQPLNAQTQLAYHTASGALRGRVELFQAEQRLLLLSAQGSTPWRDWLGPAKKAWSGRLHAQLDGVNLSAFKAFSELGLDGRVTGSAALQSDGQQPALYAQLDVARPSVLGTQLGQAQLRVRSSGQRLTAELRANNEVGSAAGRLSLGWLWRDVLPTLDAAEPVRADLQLDNFDAVMLAPFTRDVFSEIRGPLNGKLHATLQRQPTQAALDAAWSGQIDGELRLTQGVLGLARVGLKLEDVALTAAAKGNSSGTTILVRDFVARAESEAPNVQASAQVKLDGLKFDEAQATIELARNKDVTGRDPDPVPLPFEGIPQARVRGIVRAELKRRPDWMEVSVNIPQLTGEVTEGAERELITLDAEPDITVRQPLEKPLPPSDPDSFPWKVQLVLGDQVEVKRAGLRLGLRGRPEFVLGEQVSASGSIDMKRAGLIQIASRPFLVERGEVRFDTGDPANPHINLSASWRAPDSTTFNLELQGTLQDPLPRLTSDPPSGSENEVWAKLLGLSGDDAATDLGIGIGADILGKAFAKTPVALRAGRHTTGVQRSSASPSQAPDQQTYLSAGVAYRVSDKLSLEGSIEKMETTPITRTEQQDSGVTGTVDYRIDNNWSLRTNIGTIGAGLDLLWQYRY